MGMKMPSYFIPYSWLPYFALTEDHIDHRNHAAFQTPSILTLLDKAGRTYCYDTFTALNFQSLYQSDNERLNAVICDIKKSPKDLYLVYIAAADVYAHYYGPDSPEFRKVIRDLDKNIELFVQNLERTVCGNRYLFLGDHGMMTVIKRIDAEQEISRLLRTVHLCKGQDVLYFLDSTMVRLWAIGDKKRSLLSDALTTSEIFNENGAWMDDAMARRNHVPWPDRRYGDYLWIANPGTLVFPDFFHRNTPCRGMHGYDPYLPESRGMCINWGRGIPSSKHSFMPLTRTFDILKKNLEL
jgi:predicted AlkP superfamily pyrophosphatase or phosphodiesterase